MSTCRRGSILLFCLALVGALAVIAYGFVRVAQLHRASGDSGNLRLLANEAAVMGVDHAVEQILRDYVNETGTTPVTAMDGPAMRAFSSHDMPSMMSNSSDDEIVGTRNGAAAVNLDDMPASDAFDRLQLGSFQSNAGEEPLSAGYLSSSGRGRFYEPEFYNRARPTATQPTVPVRFGDVTVPLPDRNAGIFYDDRLCRIPGPQLAARERARYRLRYAVVTVDLEGQILVNGDQGVDHGRIDAVDPRAIADPAVARVVRNMHRLPAIVDAYEGFGKNIPNNGWLTGGPSCGVAAEHVFIGRGAAHNVDRRRDRGSAPLTYPFMYRRASDPSKFIPVWGIDGAWPGADLYTDTGVLGQMAGGEEIPDAASPIAHMLTGPQFTFINWMQATYGNGSEGVNNRGQAPLDRYTPFGRGVSAAAAGEPISRYRGHVDTPWNVNLLTVTPRLFNAMVSGYMPPGGIALRYSLRADAPVGWVLEMPDNPADAFPDTMHPTGSTALTLSGGSGTIRVGYVLTLAGDPNRYKVLSAATSPHWDPIRAAAGVKQCVITIAPGLVLPNDNALPAGADTYLDGTAATMTTPANFYAATRTRDLFVAQLNEAFARYQAPQRIAAGVNPAIQPDYHVDDFWKLPPAATNAVYRGPAERYPGVMGFNGFNPEAVHAPGNAGDMEGEWLHDTLGTYLRAIKTGAKDTSGRWIAQKVRSPSQGESGSHAAGSFWPNFNHENQSTITPTCTDTLTPPYPYTPAKPSRVGPHPDSIWEVIGQAMAATGCMVQGQWLTYPNAKTTTTLARFPAQWFDGAAWSGPRATTIRDVDALFVANLGSSFAKPNDPIPVKVWYGSSSPLGVRSFVPEWNLAKLRTAKASDTATHDLYALNDPTEPGYVMSGTTVPVPGATGSDATERCYVGGVAGSTTFTATERTQLAELIINDVRLSFFGSSPQYGDAFRALDLNGDGKAACSGFHSNGLATARELALAIDQFTTSVDADGIATVPVDTYFSNTGCFSLGKSRFWHIMVRGEVWDNLAKCTVDRAQLETMLCVDPVGAANEVGTAGPQDPGGGQYSTHIIYQSWVHNDMREFLSRRY